MGKISTATIMIILIIMFIPLILCIISQWKLFVKAGKPGWAIFVPIYSTLVLLEIIRKPWWWLLLMLIPGVNIVISIWATNLFVKAFGKSEGYTVGVLFFPFIFMPLLAFDKNTQYIYAPSREINDIGTTTY